MMRGHFAAIPLLLAVLASGDRSELGDQSQPRPRVRNPESGIHDLQSPIPKNVQWFEPTATELSDGGVLNDAVKNVKKASETLKGLSGAVFDRIDEHRQNVEGVRDSMDKRDALINALDTQILGQLTDSDTSRMKAVNDATAGILPPVDDEDDDEGDLVDLAEGEEEAGRKKKVKLENYVSDVNPFVDDPDAAPFRNYEGKYRTQHRGSTFADAMGSRGEGYNVGNGRSSSKSGKIPVSGDHGDAWDYDAPRQEYTGSGSRGANSYKATSNPRESVDAARFDKSATSRLSSSRSHTRNVSLHVQGVGVSSGGRFTGKASVPLKSETMKRWEEEPLEETTRSRGDPRSTGSWRDRERLSPLLDSLPDRDSDRGGRTVTRSGAVTTQRNARTGIPAARKPNGSSGQDRAGISGAGAREDVVDRSLGRRDIRKGESSRNVLKDSRGEDSMAARLREREAQDARKKSSPSKIPFLIPPSSTHGRSSGKEATRPLSATGGRRLPPPIPLGRVLPPPIPPRRVFGEPQKSGALDVNSNAATARTESGTNDWVSDAPDFEESSMYSN